MKRICVSLDQLLRQEHQVLMPFEGRWSQLAVRRLCVDYVHEQQNGRTPKQDICFSLFVIMPEHTHLPIGEPLD